MRVSVVIPATNAPATLERCVAAVEASTEPPDELIVVDDHSTDATAQRVEEFRAAHPEVDLTLVRKERRQGLARNYVDGAFLGRGKYYKIVNGDNAEPKESIRAANQ